MQYNENDKSSEDLKLFIEPIHTISCEQKNGQKKPVSNIILYLSQNRFISDNYFVPYFCKIPESKDLRKNYFKEDNF